MTTANFNLAMSIILEFHSTQIIVNHVEPNGQVQKVLDSPTISIVNCCAGLTKKLLNRGFALSVHDGKLTLGDYSVMAR